MTIDQEHRDESGGGFQFYEELRCAPETGRAGERV